MAKIELVNRTGAEVVSYYSADEAKESGYSLFLDVDGDYVLYLSDGAWALCEKGEDGLQGWNEEDLACPLVPVLDQSLVISN